MFSKVMKNTFVRAGSTAKATKESVKRKAKKLPTVQSSALNGLEPAPSRRPYGSNAAKSLKRLVATAPLKESLLRSQVSDALHKQKTDPTRQPPELLLADRTLSIIAKTLDESSGSALCTSPTQPPLAKGEPIEILAPKVRMLGAMPGPAVTKFVADAMDLFNRTERRSEFSGESVVDAHDAVQKDAGPLPLVVFSHGELMKGLGLADEAVEPIGKDWCMRFGPFVDADGKPTPFIHQEPHFHQNPVDPDNKVSELRLLAGIGSAFTLLRHAGGVIVAPPGQFCTITIPPKGGHQFCALLPGALQAEPELQKRLLQGGELDADTVARLDKFIAQLPTRFTAQQLLDMRAEETAALFVSTHLEDPPAQGSDANLMVQATKAIGNPEAPYLRWP